MRMMRHEVANVVLLVDQIGAVEPGREMMISQPGCL